MKDVDSNNKVVDGNRPQNSNTTKRIVKGVVLVVIGVLCVFGCCDIDCLLGDLSALFNIF